MAYRGRNIAGVLDLTVEEAAEFFADTPAVARSLAALLDVGLGYLRLGQPATELSGGEAQRIKLASELQRGRRRHTLYLLDEPTTGLHPADVEVLMRQLHGLVDAGHTVVVVEHDMARGRGRRPGDRPGTGRRRGGRPDRRLGVAGRRGAGERECHRAVSGQGPLDGAVDGGTRR